MINRKFRLTLVGVSATVLVFASATALGGSGVGSIFNLGKTNTVKRQTVLTGSAGSAAQLRIRNTGQGPALEALVRPSVPPFKVNSNARVANLNADELDGVDSAALQRRLTGTCAPGTAVRNVAADGGVTCQTLWSLGGNADTSAATNFLGTTDAQPLVVKTNNAEALRVDAARNVGVGTATPIARLEASGTEIALLGTSLTRAVVGRLGTVSCGGMYAVGGCAADTGGIGVLGRSGTGVAVHGTSDSNRAVEGFSGTGIGVIGDSTARGVVGTLGRASCPGTYAVGGCTGSSPGDGVLGWSNTGAGIVSVTGTGNLFYGEAPSGTLRVRIDATGKGFFNGGTQTGGADYAESMRTTDTPARLEPGDVLAIDPEAANSVRRSREPNSRLVAGVYSTKPSILAVGDHGVNDPRTGEVPVAILGIVPTKVSAENGRIQAGDLLTTASAPGYAMKASPVVVSGVEIYPTGAILGKALQPLEGRRGIIKVLVTLR